MDKDLKIVPPRENSQTLPKLIVKSPRSTGFSTADEDIPFVTIASLKSNSSELEQNFAGAGGIAEENGARQQAIDLAVSDTSQIGSSPGASPSRMR